MRQITILGNEGRRIIRRLIFLLALIPTTILAGRALGADVLTIHSLQGKGSEAAIPIRQSRGLAYLDVNEFAAAMNLNCTVNPDRRKFQCLIGSARIILTANNAFAIVGADTRQLPSEIIYQDQRFWAPLDAFIDVFNRNYPASIEYNRSACRLTISPAKYDIHAIHYEVKDNGTLVRILCSKKIAFAAPTLRDLILTLTFQQATIDAEALQKTLPIGAVKKTSLEKRGPAVQLIFTLNTPALEYSTWQDEESKQINISIVTRLLSNSPPAGSSTPQNGEFSKIGEMLEKEQQKWQVNCVVIDPGHGGQDPGAIGVTGLQEKDVTLGISLRLKELLKKNLGLRVILTREDDRFLALSQRTKLANREGGKLFISIHCNSSKAGGGSGFETYFLKPARTSKAMEVALRENSVIDYEDSKNGYQDLTEENYILLAMAQSEFARESEALADIVQNRMRLNTGLKDRGVDQAGFYVLVGASMPAILVETAFLSSKREEKMLKTKKFRQQVAQAVYESVLEFMRRTKSAGEGVSARP